MIIVPEISPVAFSVFGLSIRWYALAYIAGFIGAQFYLKHLTRKGGWKVRETFWDDFLNYAVLGVILGGRLGYVVFYNAGYFMEHPLQIFAIWQGGMSFHGGMLGLASAAWFYARKEKVRYLFVQDLLVVVAPIGLFLGRVANFINGELLGKPTQSALGMLFPGETVPRHASPLYEAFFEGLVLFIILNVMFRIEKVRNYRGFLTGGFLIGYGIFRIGAEFIKLPDAHIGYLAWNWLTVGQILSLPMIFLGIVFIWRSKNKPTSDF